MLSHLQSPQLSLLSASPSAAGHSTPIPPSLLSLSFGPFDTSIAALHRCRPCLCPPSLCLRPSVRFCPLMASLGLSRSAAFHPPNLLEVSPPVLYPTLAAAHSTSGDAGLTFYPFLSSHLVCCATLSELSLPLSECVSLLRSLRSVPDVVGVTTVDGGVAAPQPANGNVSAARGPSSSPIPASSYSASITAPQLAASLFTSPAAAPCPPPERPWSALAGYAAAGVSFCPPSALSLHSSSSSSVLSSSLSSSSQAVAVSGARSIFTLCQKLDWLLGDGVRLSELTEFCGVPGVGQHTHATLTPSLTQTSSSVQSISRLAVPHM